MTKLKKTEVFEGDRVLDSTPKIEVNEEIYPEQSKEGGNERLNEKFKEAEKELSPFILDEKDIPQQIDHALGSIKIRDRQYRYYGIKVSQKIERKNAEGKNILSPKKFQRLLLKMVESFRNTLPHVILNSALL